MGGEEKKESNRHRCRYLLLLYLNKESAKCVLEYPHELGVQYMNTRTHIHTHRDDVFAEGGREGRREGDLYVQNL